MQKYHAAMRLRIAVQRLGLKSNHREEHHHEQT
jgi:hypothetical protein